MNRRLKRWRQIPRLRGRLFASTFADGVVRSRHGLSAIFDNIPQQNPRTGGTSD